jgi:RNA polymerase sigma-70 factor (ECF subfamily)
VDDRSDEILVAASSQGDKNAYAVLVQRHYRHVFAMCFGMLANVHDAEDIAQDAILRGLSKIAELRKGVQFGRWILRIAGNLCIDLIRRRKRIKRVDWIRQAHHEAEYPAIAQQAMNENHDLHHAIERLPKELRVPLVMYYFDGKNAKAIAERLNISHSGACQKIRSARQQLHELLTGRL